MEVANEQDQKRRHVISDRHCRGGRYRGAKDDTRSGGAASRNRSRRSYQRFQACARARDGQGIHRGQSLTGPGQATGRADIHGSQATIAFPSLAPGEYAVIAAHDENDNGEVDHGMFGPSEPIGFSNGFRLRRLLLSFPTFKKLKFVLAPDRNRIEVTVR
jgi:Uncharacterized protein conserved in bacteria (DUF2141)